MKTSSDLPRGSAPVRAILCFLLAVLFLAAFAGGLKAAEPDTEFDRRFEEWRRLPDDAKRGRQAEPRFFPRGFSSAQVKRMALAITNEDARVEFVVAAYPRTVDPENFHDVYDAFQTFSKVFRMHDRIAALRQTNPVPGRPAVTRPAPLTSEEWSGTVASVRREAFDDNRLAKVRLLEAGLRGRITCAQAAELMKVFSFDEGRLAAGKVLAVCVTDPANTRLMVDALSFPGNREDLMTHLTANPAGRPPRVGW